MRRALVFVSFIVAMMKNNVIFIAISVAKSCTQGPIVLHRYDYVVRS